MVEWGCTTIRRKTDLAKTDLVIVGRVHFGAHRSIKVKIKELGLGGEG